MTSTASSRPVQSPGRSQDWVSAPLGFGSIGVRPPLATPGQRIGLLGGSFNPAHEGHVRLSQFALQRLGLDAVWWLVSPGNPLKSHAELASQSERIAACCRIARDNRIRITGFEAAMPSAYTAATLTFLARRYPLTRFVWLMGADSLASFHRWRQWRKILGTMPMAVVDRPGWRLRAMSSKTARHATHAFVPERRARALADRDPPAWTLLTVPLSSQSSTAIRARAARAS